MEVAVSTWKWVEVDMEVDGKASINFHGSTSTSIDFHENKPTVFSI